MLFSPNKMTRNSFKGNSVCHYEILRDEVEGADFTRFDKFMEKLKSFRTIPRQKVMFTFGGYDDDKRELISISEVVRYAKKVVEDYPYIWYFAITINSEFFVIADLFDENNYTILSNSVSRKFYTEHDKDRFKLLFQKMGASLEKFGKHINDTEGALEAFKIWTTCIMQITS